MSFVQRLVNSQFTLSSGNFQESGTNQVSLSGYRTSCRITKSGTVQQTMTLRVWGMSLSLMNQLSTLGMVITNGYIPKNMVTVTAGDAGGAMNTVFQGTITNAWANLSTPGDASFDVEATGALSAATQTIPATSYQGSADVPTIMQKFASQGGWTFENNSVTAKLADPYFHGSLLSQIQECAQAANIYTVIDNGTLCILPSGKNRTTNDTPLISATSEPPMVGYPSYTPQGIIVSSVYNPAIKFFGLVQVDSILKLSVEKWAVNGIDYALDSLLPQGEWKSTFQCYDPGYVKQIVN
jgi:hypothetical protein